MFRRVCISLLIAGFVLLLPVAAQAPPEPPSYTFVAEWNVPRAQWAEVTANFEKNSRPVLDRLMAAGTLTGWGSFASAVHSVDGPTHGTWFSASSVANIQKAFDELVRAPVNPAMESARHWDYYLRSITSKSKSVSAGSSGYLWVSSTKVQPGKGGEWRDLWEKYGKPVFDELLANGTITSYSVDAEYVHTDDPGWRHIVYTAPSADAIDKFGAATQAANQKRTAEERRAIGDSFAAVTVAGTHRDFFARVVSYAHK